jgi:hypothetical protein
LLRKDAGAVGAGPYHVAVGDDAQRAVAKVAGIDAAVTAGDGLSRDAEGARAGEAALLRKDAGRICGGALDIAVGDEVQRASAGIAGIDAVSAAANGLGGDAE